MSVWVSSPAFRAFEMTVTLLDSAMLLLTDYSIFGAMSFDLLALLVFLVHPLQQGFGFGCHYWMIIVPQLGVSDIRGP